MRARHAEVVPGGGTLSLECPQAGLAHAPRQPVDGAGSGSSAAARPSAVCQPLRRERTRRSARFTGCRPRGGRCLPSFLPLLRVEVVERVSNRPCSVVRLYHRVRARRRIALGLSGARVFHGLVGTLSRSQENAGGTADLWHAPSHPAWRRRYRARFGTLSSPSSALYPRFRQLHLQLAADSRKTSAHSLGFGCRNRRIVGYQGMSAQSSIQHMSGADASKVRFPLVSQETRDGHP